jgi:hypothetical protein
MVGKGIATLKGLETELGNCNLKGRGEKKEREKGVRKFWVGRVQKKIGSLCEGLIAWLDLRRFKGL